MAPRVLQCAACDIRVEGTFRSNEFSLLEDDYLQLLRVFVLCEGRIRDMEKALGISYPTVKTRLAALRNRLGLHHEPSDDNVMSHSPSARTESQPASDNDNRSAGGAASTNSPAAMSVLELLGSGAIDHAEAVRRLRET